MPDANEQVLKFCDEPSPRARMNDASRYALYYAPEEGSEWASFGEQWFARIDEAPRRYGFHATLKAPFRLAQGSSPQALLDHLLAYCARRSVWTMPPLKIALLDDFLALVPEVEDPEIDLVAAQCVTLFDQYRAPLNECDLARRKPERLDAGELGLLTRWGYPYVLERFRFHLSLSGPLGGTDPRRIAELTLKASKAMHSLGRPAFDAICVFEEPREGGPFRLLRRVPFTG